ncbi:hypothetical protein Ccar_11310 [Clostridium carboxidivorans P7]|uniref:Lipoprotein n=1 Tax=Clostridium carboxidivorans P7 TaxID=536227 RepID=C6Q329_9CLOT|nr:hypothetical protein [Clostridium carboxidivorans]AKN31412.1 hypothetical protein Ccar_11310 [Clostridium carboxidivorans P7]EET84103.1 hypothetical protein CcarbDRAFT_5448 [Clostridium carboxidivorans P7]EFG87197.1 lipoprotein, putative [Clostridium carboxidivorans P7]
MRRIVCSIFIVAALFVCSMSLTSCKAITAQNITNMGSGQGMNGGGMNGGPGMDGNRMSNADLIGKIVSVDGNTIKIEVAKQDSNGNAAPDMKGNQNANGTPNMNDNQASKGMSNTNGSSNVNGNQSNNNNDSRKPPQGGFPDGKLELSYTGEAKTITVNSDVKISERTAMPGQNRNDNSKSSTKVSDLKKGQVIMIWYKQNTKAVERISVTQLF